jgi:hypothetical protein
MDGIGEGLDDIAQEVGAVCFAGVVAELDVGEFGDPVDCQTMLSLPSARRSSLMSMWTYPIAVAANLPRLAVLVGSSGSREMPCRSRQRCRLERVSFGMLSRRHPSTSSSGRSVRRPNSTTIASSARLSTVLWGELGPICASWTVVRLRHLLTVVRLRP